MPSVSRTSRSLVLGAVGAALAAVGPARADCPVGPDCPCFNTCSWSRGIDLDSTISVDFELLPPAGCTVKSSSGSLIVFGAALGFVSGETDGPCNMDMCSKLFLDTQADAAIAPDLTMTPISLAVEAEAGAAGIDASGSASGSVTPLTFSTSIATHGEISTSQTTCLFQGPDQITMHSGFAMAAAVAGGTLSTSFAGDCSGLTSQLALEVEMTLQTGCTVDPPGCDGCPGGAGTRTLGAVFVSVGTGSGTGPGAGSPVLQGVFGLQEDGDGNVIPSHLGFFEGSGFDPVGQPDTLIVAVPLPDESTQVDAAPQVDYFSDHDGDLDGDGLVCAADALRMSGLIGVVLGDASYTPRADFDFDGAITALDLGAFEKAYLPSDECCLGDLDGDGSVGFSDLLLVLNGWGPCAGLCPADIDGDGDIGFADLLVVLNGWGPCPE